MMTKVLMVAALVLNLACAALTVVAPVPALLVGVWAAVVAARLGHLCPRTTN